MEDDTWKEEEVSHWSPSQLCSDSPPSTTLSPAALLPANAALPHAMGPGALPGVANPLLFLLHRREERRKQEERWCEGKSPGASRPDSGRDLLSGLRQALASPMVTRQIQGQALPRSPGLCSSAFLSPSLLGADWGWQVACVAQSTREGQILRRVDLRLYGVGKLCKGAKGTEMVTEVTSSCPRTGWALVCAYTSVACKTHGEWGAYLFHQALGSGGPSSPPIPVSLCPPLMPKLPLSILSGPFFLFSLTSPSALWGLLPLLSAAPSSSAI